MMDLHAERQPADHDPLDRDGDPPVTASGAGLEGEVVAHLSPPMQAGRPWNESCQLGLAMTPVRFDDALPPMEERASPGGVGDEVEGFGGGPVPEIGRLSISYNDFIGPGPRPRDPRARPTIIAEKRKGKE